MNKTDLDEIKSLIQMAIAAAPPLPKPKKVTLKNIFADAFKNGNTLSTILGFIITIGIILLGLSVRRGVEVLSNLPVLEEQVKRNTLSIENLNVTVGEVRDDVIRLKEINARRTK